MSSITTSFGVAWLLTLSIACSPPANNQSDAGDVEPDMGPGTEPLFPEDLSDWREARDCRFSHEHELAYIRVFVDSAAEEPYRELSADFPYPAGATLVKPAYMDEDCTTLIGYTAMQKLDAEDSAGGSGWRWQRLNADREVTMDGEIDSCISCHRHHCTPGECGYPDCGYDLTCNEEL